MDDAALRESLLELYEQAPCGYLFTLPDGLITRVNQTFLDWTGYERGELVSAMRMQDLLTMGGRIFHHTHWAHLLRMQGSVSEVKLEIALPAGADQVAGDITRVLKYVSCSSLRSVSTPHSAASFAVRSNWACVGFLEKTWPVCR